MPLNAEDFRQYDIYKNISGSEHILSKVMKERTLFDSVFYWDNHLDAIMIEMNIERYEPQRMSKTVDDFKKILEIYRKGVIKMGEVDADDFELFKEYLYHIALGYYLRKHRPYVLLKIKYHKLDELEVDCVFEHIIHHPRYIAAKEAGEILLPFVVGWWQLKDIVEKYKSIVLYAPEYGYQGDSKW